ncbi:MAG: hypothetical protein V4773_22410 [Verrucomicrobiota bacterium]
MSATPAPTSTPAPTPASSAWRAIFWSGLAAGVLDIGYIIVYYLLKNVPASAVLQGVAAGAVGRATATKGGMAMAALGLAFHFFIAFCAAAFFYAASRKLRWLVEKPVLGGLVFGVGVWLFMNLAVLPLSATPPAKFPSPTWLPVLIAHLVCVGLPIAFITRKLAK